MMMKIVHQFQSKNKYLNKLAEKMLDDMPELDKKVNRNDLIYRCKDKTPDENFNTNNNTNNSNQQNKKW